MADIGQPCGARRGLGRVYAAVATVAAVGLAMAACWRRPEAGAAGAGTLRPVAGVTSAFAAQGGNLTVPSGLSSRGQIAGFTSGALPGARVPSPQL